MISLERKGALILPFVCRSPSVVLLSRILRVITYVGHACTIPERSTPHSLRPTGPQRRAPAPERERALDGEKGKA